MKSKQREYERLKNGNLVWNDKCEITLLYVNADPATEVSVEIKKKNK